MAESVADLINSGLAKNPGIATNSQNGAAIYNQINQSVVGAAQTNLTSTAELIKQKEEALQARKLLDQIAIKSNEMLGKKLQEEDAAVAVRAAGAIQTKQVLQAERDKKIQELGKIAIEDANTSFFSNPIAWLGTKTKKIAAENAVETLSESVILANNSIDDEYKVAHNNFVNYQTSAAMLAQKQAEQEAQINLQKEALDVQIAADRREAEVQSLTLMAKELKVDPVAQERQILAMRKAASRPDTTNPAIQAFGAAYKLDMTNPTTYAQTAEAFDLMSAQDKAKWVGIGQATAAQGKGFTSTAVLQSAVSLEDAPAAMQIISKINPELANKMQKSIEAVALSDKAMFTSKVEELTLANKTAPPSEKLSPEEIQVKVRQDMIGGVYAKGASAVLSVGKSIAEQGLGAAAKALPQEVLDGKSIAEWAQRDPSLDAKAVEALKSPNVQAEYNRGHYAAGVGGLGAVLDNNASRMLAGVNSMVSMGVEENVAIETMTKVMKKAIQGHLRISPQAAREFDSFQSIGIDLSPQYKVKSIRVNSNIFSPDNFTADATIPEIDILNPSEFANLLARLRAAEKATKTIPGNPYAPGTGTTVPTDLARQLKAAASRGN